MAQCPGPGVKEYKYFPLAPREWEGGAAVFVPPFHPFPPPSSRKISCSNLAYSPPEVERKAIRPAYWTRPGEIRFSWIFRVGQNDGRDRRALKRERRFQAGSKIEAERLRVGGWSACASYLRAEGEKRKGARVRPHLPRILREQFPSLLFKALPLFLPNLSHGLTTDPIQVSILCAVYI